jgi:hypothetical protein
MEVERLPMSLTMNPIVCSTIVLNPLHLRRTRPLAEESRLRRTGYFRMVSPRSLTKNFPPTAAAE